MKKNIMKTLLVAIIFLIGFTFSACSFDGLFGETNIYETNVIQGNIDIELLYEEYLRENPNATFEDFIQSLSLNNLSAEYAAEQAIYSIVSVYSRFTENTSGFPWQGGTTSFTSAGAGVIYKISGNDVYIITNYHVVYNRSSVTENHIANGINVYTYGCETDEKAVPVEFVGGEITNDIAILKANKSDFSSEIREVQIADSSKIKLGSLAVAIGNPLSAGIAVTSGIVSVVLEIAEMEALDASGQIIEIEVIRVDAAINSGNSGGGLFNSSGELIGIVNAKAAQSNVENIGYAIPSNHAIRIANEFI